MFCDLSNKRILLVSSSLGFRAPSPIGSRFLPFRLKIFSDERIPWILDYYSRNCVRLYKSGFTLIDFLIYLDKYDISLDEFDYAVFNFGIVEGWIRDSFSKSDNEEANWENIIDRLLLEAIL